MNLVADKLLEYIVDAGHRFLAERLQVSCESIILSL
jgi:hypothetical protein